MFKTKILLLFSLLILMAMPFVNSPVCDANAAEPPSILIIVPDAPEDLEIIIGPQNIKANRTDKVMESYFTLYSGDLRYSDNTLKITQGDSTFEITLGMPLESYNNIFTLDLKNRTLTPGKSISRSFSLISLRIILTLIIEGAVFFLFGYRKKKSWIVFLIINLITQGLLNIWLNGFAPLASYIIFSLILAEILVFIIEMIAFLVVINEHHRLRTFFYVLMANLLSLIAGGFLITVLPI